MEAILETGVIFKLSDALPVDKEHVNHEFLPTEKRVVAKLDGKIQHMNYLSYLELCWAKHYNVVLKPDYLWHIVLCELAEHIKTNAEKYRHLFTESKEKQTITVSTLDPFILPMDQVVNQLKKLVPADVEAFLPSFSTSTPLSTFAFNAAFCDAMSPYYNYTMFMCSFPKIKVEGSVEDWQKTLNSISKLRTYFELSEYFDKLTTSFEGIIDAISTNNGKIFETFFLLEKCGSGSQKEVSGWIRNFYIKKVRTGFVSNYSSCVSQVEYKNLSTNREFIAKVGLFNSNFENDFLTPEFGYVVYNNDKE